VSKESDSERIARLEKEKALLLSSLPTPLASSGDSGVIKEIVSSKDQDLFLEWNTGQGWSIHCKG